MNRSEIMDIINEVEGKFPVDEWIVNKIHIWPLIRFQLFSNYNNCRYHISETNKILYSLHAVGKTLNGIRGYYSSYFSDHKKNIKPHKSDIVFLNNNSHYTFINGSWYARFCDPLVSSFNKAGLTSFIMTNGYKYLVPRYSPSMFIQPYLILRRVFGILLSADFIFRNKDWYFLSDLKLYLNQLKLPSINLNTKKVISYFYQVQAVAAYFKKILQIVRPKIVFIVCYYDTESMALNLACRQCGIPTVDIQHGIQGDQHAAYGRWSKLPKNGYEMLPSIFWCWSNHEAEVIGKWSKNVSEGHEAIIGGNLFLNEWITVKNNIYLKYDQIIANLKNRKRADTIYILYTLSGIRKGEKNRLIETINEINDDHLNCVFWIRLHPCYLGEKEIIRSLLLNSGINNFDLDNATDLPLYGILRHMDLHITEGSSVAIEAQLFGVPSILLRRESGLLWYTELVSSGWVVLATGHDITALIRQQLEKKGNLKLPPAINYSSQQNDAMRYLLHLLG